jgi:hypothetical protein
MNRLSFMLGALAFCAALDASASIFEEGGVQVTVRRGLNCAKTSPGISCWDTNWKGQGPASFGETKALVANSHVLCAITPARKVVCASPNQSSSGTVPYELSPSGPRETRVLSLVGKSQGFCAIVRRGNSLVNEVLCWKTYGTGPESPVAIKNPSQLVSSGPNLCALTAEGPVCVEGEPPADLSSLKDADHLTFGRAHACALVKGAVRCVGTIHQKPVEVPVDLLHPRSLVSGDFHSCVITDTGIRCWGFESDGSNPVPYPAPSPASDFVGATNLVTSESRTCAVTPRGMRCWGYDPWHAWVENKVTLRSPRNLRAAGGAVCADTDDGLRCWASWQATDAFRFTASHNPALLAGDGSFVCAADSQGQVACQGNNDNHQLEVPANLTGVRQLASGYRFTCALTDAGVSCWGQPYTPAILTPPNGLAGAEQIAVNSFVACVLKDDRPICWGKEGATKIPENLGTVTRIVAGEPNLCVLDTSKNLKCWNPLSVAPPRVLSQRVERVEASAGDLVCAVLENGDARCWDRFFSMVGSTSDSSVLSHDPSDIAVLQYSVCATRGEGVLCQKLEGSGQRRLMTFSAAYQHPEWSVIPVDVPITAKPAPALRALLPKLYAEKKQFLARVASLVEASSTTMTVESGVPGFAFTALWPFLSNLSAPSVAESVQADFGDAPGFLVTQLGVATLNDWHKSEPHLRFAVQMVQAALSSVRPMLSSDSQRQAEDVLMVAGEVLSNGNVTESDGRRVHDAFTEEPQTLLSELKKSPRLDSFALMLDQLIDWLGSTASRKR